MGDPIKKYLSFIFNKQKEGVVDSHLILIALVKQYCVINSVQREQWLFSNYLTKLSPDHPKKLLHRLYHQKDKNIIRAFLSVFGDYERFVPPKTLSKLGVENIWEKSYETLLLQMFGKVETCFDQLEDVFIPANIAETLLKDFLFKLPSLETDKIYTACTLLQMVRDYLPKEEEEVNKVAMFLKKAVSHGYSFNSDKALETIAILHEYLPALRNIKMDLLENIVHGAFHPCALSNDRLSQWVKLSKVKFLFDDKERRQILESLFLLIEPEIKEISLLANCTVSIGRENQANQDLYQTFLFEAIWGLRSWIEPDNAIYDKISDFLLQFIETNDSFAEKVKQSFFGPRNGVAVKQLQLAPLSNQKSDAALDEILSESEKLKTLLAYKLETILPAMWKTYRQSIDELSQDAKIALMTSLLNGQKKNAKVFMMVYAYYRRATVDAALTTQPFANEMIEAIKQYRY